MADPDLAHFNVASLITSTDRQISKEAPFFKDIGNLRLINRSIGDNFPDPATFSKEARYNFRTGLHYRYESTAVKEEDAIYHNRVSALGIVLFCVIIPHLDRRQVSSISDYLWSILIKCLSLRFEAKHPPGEDFVIACGQNAVLYRKPNVADKIRTELEAERIKYAFKKRLEQDTARIKSAAATEATKATQQIRERYKKDLEEARALLTEEFQEQLKEAAELERAYKKPTSTSPANISRSLSEPKVDVITVTLEGDGEGSDHMVQAGQEEVRGIGCRQTEDDPSVPKLLNTTGVSPAPEAAHEIHQSAISKASRTNPSHPNEHDVRSLSNNNHKPNDDGIIRSEPVVIQETLHTAHQGNGGESDMTHQAGGDGEYRRKRRRADLVAGPVYEDHSSMKALNDKLNLILAAVHRKNGWESKNKHQEAGGGPWTEKAVPSIALPTQGSAAPGSAALAAVHEPPSVSKTSPTNTSQNLNNVDPSGGARTKSSNSRPADPSQILKEDDVNSSLGNSPQPNKDGIDRSTPQAAHQEGGDESRGLKRKAISPPTPQGNGGAVSPTATRVHRIHSAISTTPNVNSSSNNAQSISQPALTFTPDSQSPDDEKTSQDTQSPKSGAISLVPQAGDHEVQPSLPTLNRHSETAPRNPERDLLSVINGIPRVGIAEEYFLRDFCLNNYKMLKEAFQAWPKAMNPQQNPKTDNASTRPGFWETTMGWPTKTPEGMDLTFDATTLQLCAALRRYMLGKKYRIHQREGKDRDPVLISPHTQGFSLQITQNQRGLETYLNQKTVQTVPQDGVRKRVIEGSILCDYLKDLLGNVKFDFDGCTEPPESDVFTTRAVAIIEAPNGELVTITFLERGFVAVAGFIQCLKDADVHTLE